MAERPFTNFFAIHCSDTKANMDIGEKEIRAWHIERGWSDIGYNVTIRRNGRVEIGRPLEHIGAHVKGHNSDSLGICLVGGKGHDGKPQDNFTPQQWESLELTLKWLRLAWPSASIRGHSDLILAGDPPKACPCFNVVEWCNERGIDPL
jgi:N-acetylmuramoyl-L-alanine amidase